MTVIYFSPSVSLYLFFSGEKWSIFKIIQNEQVARRVHIWFVDENFSAFSILSPSVMQWIQVNRPIDFEFKKSQWFVNLQCVVWFAVYIPNPTGCLTPNSDNNTMQQQRER